MFHDLPFANWRTWRACGIIHPESEDLRTRRADVRRQQKADVPDEANTAHAYLLHLFALFRTSNDGLMPTSLGEGDTSYSVF